MCTALRFSPAVGTAIPLAHLAPLAGVKELSSHRWETPKAQRTRTIPVMAPADLAPSPPSHLISEPQHPNYEQGWVMSTSSGCRKG